MGIITAPLVHKDLMHLFNNSVPLLVAIFAIAYFYHKAYLRILLFSYILTHILIWLLARGDSYHIGASGLVYTYLSFLFFGSAFSSNKSMLALSLIIIFLYGAMVWGILPVETNISWESHLMGAIIGLLFAFIYRKQIPPEKKFDWEEEEDNIDDMTDEEIDELIDQKLNVKYWYKLKKNKKDL